MNRHRSDGRQIPVVGPDISYETFLDKFLRPLKPCIITGLTENWPAAEQWTTLDPKTNNSTVNFSLLMDIFKSSKACVTFCDEPDANGDPMLREMPVSEFMDEFCKNLGSGITKKTYLKDFHFMRAIPYVKSPYTVPKFFQDDWFNRFAVAHDKDDFRFLYLGEDGSFTPLHHDVCKSHSWSTSLCGTKAWTFIPPEDAVNLYDTNGSLPKTLDTTEARFINIEKARKAAISVTQYAGETIFVPSGWYHQVINHGAETEVSPTLSLNHNWFNAACLRVMYDSLCWQYHLSQEAIIDLKEGTEPVEFEGLVQGLLKANYGMDWDSWWDLVDWNVKNKESENRMNWDEEKEIAFELVKKWLYREEASLIPGLKERVTALGEYLS